MLDGFRDGSYEDRDRYEDYKRAIIWKCHHEYNNVLPVVFEQHTHQAGMTRHVLSMIETPTILFVEHDAPLVIDYEIPLDKIADTIITGAANVVRFHHEASILDVHKHLMLDSEPRDIGGVPMMRTRQWSQRPHLASAEFYRHMLKTYFDEDAKTMIEDVMHGVVDSAVVDGGAMAWNLFRLWTYTPVDSDDNIKRSYHLDGRGNDKKVIDADNVVDL